MSARWGIHIRTFNSRENGTDENKWTVKQGTYIISVKHSYSVWNAIIGWIISFLAFGPLFYYLYNYAGYSYDYTLFQGIFVASFSQAVIMVFYRLRKIKASSSPADIWIAKQ